MKYYKLVERITNEEDIEDMVILLSIEYKEPESVLQIEDNYYILRIVKNGWLYYMHRKDDKIIKICIYREE